MEIKKCQRCRAIPDASWKRYADGRYECPYCGSLNDLDAYDLADGAPRRQKSDDYTKIYSYLENLKFREAGEELRTLRVKYKGDATVYFLSVLADNCVCYTNNDNKTKWPYDKIPTLNDIKFKNILESENVKKALDLARDEEREMYRKTFEYMESVREKIEAAYKRGDYVFDVFISTKVNKIDENGNTVLNEYGAPVKTTDYELALGIYDLIKKQAPNCKVFLSEKMKDDFIGKEYENIIFSALHTAKVFILVGNTRENVDSNWVRNEWMRYLYLMNPKSEGYKDRHFVFVTQGMASSDVPGEFRDLEHVFWGKEVGQETRLIDFVKKGVAANIKKITSVDFGTSVGTIESIAPGSMNQGVLNIGVNYGNVDEDVDAAVGSAINSIEMAANNSNAANAKRKRDAAFKELQELASAHKDAYRARLYLLLKDTSYSKFEDYFANISEMAEKPEFAKGYFENASEDDAMKMIEKAIGSVIDSLNDASAPDKARVDSRKVLKNTLKDYLAHISKELLERLIKSLEKAIDSDYAKQKGWMIRTYLEVIRLKDGDDAQTYIARRINMLGKFEGKKIFFEEATSAIAEEVLAVDKGNAYAKWFLMCIKYFSSVFSTPQNAASGNLFKADLSDESVRKDWLEDFTFMFSYAPVEKGAIPSWTSTRDIYERQTHAKTNGGEFASTLTKPILLRLFLLNIIASNWTYSSASNNIENTADRKDIELSGIELFNKYIRYDLGSSSVSTSVMGNTNLSKGMIETILKPSKHILKFRQIKSNLSTLIHIFAVQMHKHKQFSKAIELYELYLAQESDIHSFDCIITRYYIELAKIGCATKEEAYACLRPIDLKAVKLDLYKLSNNGKLSNFNVVRDEMDTIELKQTDFINYTIAQRKRKKVGVITAISLTSAVVAIIGFFTLNATVIQPSIHYNKANELFQIGDYEGALSQLYETGYGWSDTRQQELMARAGMAFKSGDYMTGIQYVEEAGGTVNIDYDCKGGNLTNNPLRSGPLAAYIQTPTRPGYVFDSWSLIDFKLTNEKEAYEASVSLKADWVICQYEITYVLNGGTNSSANPNSYTVEDPNIQLAAPIKFGNDFLGWKYDSTYVTEIDTSWCKNIILKAEWKERALTEEEIIEKNAHPLLSADGKSLTYGLYPQTCVSNSALISRLETLSPSASGYYFDQNDATYYYPYVAKPYESSYKFDDGTTIAYGTKYWFRCEPISWKVLQTSSGTYSVVSEKLLDAHRYNEDYSGTKSRTDYQGDTATVYTNNYKYSEIRSWLNTDFLDMAFALGSSSIKTTVVDNSAKTTDSTSNSYACEYTDDEVYLLSYWDYRNASYGFSSDESRRCKTTDFARARGAFSSTSSSYPNNGHYWTRSPRSDDSKFAWYVSYGGYLDAVYVDYEGGGVRPAITLSI